MSCQEYFALYVYLNIKLQMFVTRGHTYTVVMETVYIRDYCVIIYQTVMMALMKMAVLLIMVSQTNIYYNCTF